MWRHDDEFQKLLRDSIDSFALREHDLARFRKCKTNAIGFDEAIWVAMAELGWTGILIPESAGGGGQDFSSALVLAESFGKYLLPEPFVASSIIAATLLAASSSASAGALATELCSGRSIATLAFQEALDEIHPGLPKTRLESLGDEFCLTGRKVFVPAWTANTALLVTAQLNGSLAVVLVHPGSLGVAAVTHRMSDGSVTAEVSFDRVRLSSKELYLAGKAADQAVNLSLARGVLALSAQLEGLSRALLQMTIDYVNQRVQFGQPLAQFQALRHNLVSRHALIELAGASWRAAVSKLETVGYEGAREQISAAKARCSEAALEVSKSAIQYHGAFGYTEEADVGLFVNAALRWASWLGSTSTHRQAALLDHKKRRAEHV